MTDPNTSGPSILARKLVAASGADPDSDRSTLRSLRMALARAAQAELALSMAVIGVRQVRQGQGDLAEGLTDGWLAILLDGPGDQPGAICLDPAFVTAVIQHQTMGSVLKGPVADRRFTATDAAMTAPLIDAMLAQIETLTENPVDRHCFAGFRFGARVAAAADLLLSLSAEWYRQFHLTVDLGGGASQGQMIIILPERLQAEAEDRPEDGAHADLRLESAFDVAQADLTAVLCRLRLSLSDLADMQPGDMIPIQRNGFDQTELVAINGETVAICRLGQLAGMRAVRANETAEGPEQETVDGEGFQSSPVQRPELPEPPTDPAPDDPAPVPALIETPTPQEFDIEGSSQDLASEISRLAGFSGEDFPASEVESGT